MLDKVFYLLKNTVGFLCFRLVFAGQRPPQKTSSPAQMRISGLGLLFNWLATVYHNIAQYASFNIVLRPAKSRL